MAGLVGLVALEWDGKHYELDVESITAREFKSIRAHTGLKAGQFLRSLSSLDDLDADIAVALLWLFRTRAGEAAEFDDDVSVLRFLAALTPVAEDGDEAGEPGKAEDATPTAI